MGSSMPTDDGMHIPESENDRESRILDDEQAAALSLMLNTSSNLFITAKPEPEKVFCFQLLFDRQRKKSSFLLRPESPL